MGPLPPLSFTGGSATGGTAASGPSPWNQGDWNINLGGSAPSVMGSGGLSPLLIIGLVLGAAWLLTK